MRPFEWFTCEASSKIVQPFVNGSTWSATFPRKFIKGLDLSIEGFCIKLHVINWHYRSHLEGIASTRRILGRFGRHCCDVPSTSRDSGCNPLMSLRIQGQSPHWHDERLGLRERVCLRACSYLKLRASAHLVVEGAYTLERRLPNTWSSPKPSGHAPG